MVGVKVPFHRAPIVDLDRQRSHETLRVPRQVELEERRERRLERVLAEIYPARFVQEGLASTLLSQGGVRNRSGVLYTGQWEAHCSTSIGAREIRSSS